ncbi:MAG: hypothetical protein MUF66_05150 [Gammaproteobacteria bacterium]|nr:hypothetical protein [Gammaproteobacteria bacterium]
MSLTRFLQQEFVRQRPRGWLARPEVRVVSRDLERVVGYGPRADILLEREDGTRRIWIELEVSRADPVANHAKFATSHLFEPQRPSDAFLSMVSPHVALGRQNLAANTVALMRRVGMAAFQTVLVPQLSAAEVKVLNHARESDSALRRLDVAPEIERALAVTSPVFNEGGYAVHFAGNLLEVMLNVRQWNRDLASPEGARRWRRRTVTYFVSGPRSGTFAPSKFCAYVAIPKASGAGDSGPAPSLTLGMTVDAYERIEHGESRFDGGKAWRHLVERLGMSVRPLAELPALHDAFAQWLAGLRDAITVHPDGPSVLLPPPWFLSAPRARADGDPPGSPVN